MSKENLSYHFSFSFLLMRLSYEKLMKQVKVVLGAFSSLLLHFYASFALSISWVSLGLNCHRGK